MITEQTIGGYLLEEALAWLLRRTGYHLLVSEEQDPAELLSEGATLFVRGRGALHQADVLGEFTFTPPFSLPIRLFLEAKCYRTKKCGLDVVRNAHGVIHDINQNFVPSPESSQPRRRYQYCHAVFSTSGFSPEAQQYALAHQISIIDLSGESFRPLCQAVADAAHSLKQAALAHRIAKFPVTWIRAALRTRLETATEAQRVASSAERFGQVAAAELDNFCDQLIRHGRLDLLLGFPSAPFVLPLATTDKDRFLAYASGHPTHQVRLRRVAHDATGEWIINPAGDADGYELRFTLPPRLELWISHNEDHERKRTYAVKVELLSAITVYYLDRSGIRACLLQYDPRQLQQRRRRNS